MKLCGHDKNGGEFLVWRSERGSKTRNRNGQQRAFNPVAEATNGERCPVRFYKEFMKRRPESMKDPEGIPFGIKNLPWVKTRLPNFSQKQRKTRASKATSVITASGKRVFPGKVKSGYSHYNSHTKTTPCAYIRPAILLQKLAFKINKKIIKK